MSRTSRHTQALTGLVFCRQIIIGTFFTISETYLRFRFQSHSSEVVCLACPANAITTFPLPATRQRTQSFLPPTQARQKYPDERKNRHWSAEYFSWLEPPPGLHRAGFHYLCLHKKHFRDSARDTDHSSDSLVQYFSDRPASNAQHYGRIPNRSTDISFHADFRSL